ncbi:hypothetical protein [Nitrospira sp. Nam74]
MQAWHIIPVLCFKIGCATQSWEHPTKGMASFECDYQECTKLASEQAMDRDPALVEPQGRGLMTACNAKGLGSHEVATSDRLVRRMVPQMDDEDRSATIVSRQRGHGRKL